MEEEHEAGIAPEPLPGVLVDAPLRDGSRSPGVQPCRASASAARAASSGAHAQLDGPDRTDGSVSRRRARRRGDRPAGWGRSPLARRPSTAVAARRLSSSFMYHARRRIPLMRPMSPSSMPRWLRFSASMGAISPKPRVSSSDARARHASHAPDRRVTAVEGRRQEVSIEGTLEPSGVRVSPTSPRARASGDASATNSRSKTSSAPSRRTRVGGPLAGNVDDHEDGTPVSAMHRSMRCSIATAVPGGAAVTAASSRSSTAARTA